eukprot:2503609-Ditylum_brightwellii.AAC.1
MENPDKIAVMKIFGELCTYVSILDEFLLIAIITKMMHLTLMHGICESSSCAFATCASLLVSYDREGARRNCDLALSIVERLHVQNSLPRVYAIVYGGVHHYFERTEGALEYHMKAYDVGMRVGDITHSIINGNFYCAKSLLCGKELVSLKKECESILEAATKYKQESPKTMLLPILHAILTLLSQSDISLQKEMISSEPKLKRKQA